MIKILAIEEIKQVLYSVIGEVGREKIQNELALDITSSRKYIDLIIGNFIRRLASESNDYVIDDDDDYVSGIIIPTLSEALLHFMLTICTLPSERKITIINDLGLDIVVPNLRSLQTKPEKSIIVQIIKTDVEFSNLSKLESLQPIHKNIWLISAKAYSSRKYTTYQVLSNAESYNKYSNIIIDIHNFLKEAGDKSFRFVH